MATCFEVMLDDIAIHNVDTAAYIDFVQFTIQQIRPANILVGGTFTEILSTTTSSIVLSILIIILIVFIILIFLFLLAGHISLLYAICAILVAIALTFLFFGLAKTHSLAVGIDTLQAIQDSLVTSVVYAVNSILRSVIYLALCK